MVELYLHIGLPKTGTTYFQQWLDLNRVALAQAGVWVPTRPIHAHRIAVEFITDAKRVARADVVRIRTTPYDMALGELVAGLGDRRFAAAVVSSEYFFECLPQQLAPLRRAVGEARIHVVLYLRRQDKLLESAYNQEVKAMGLARAMGPPAYNEKFNWLTLFESWAAVFGDRQVKVVNYDLAIESKQLLDSFCAAIGLPAGFAQQTRTDIPDAQNRSLPANLLEFKRLANVFGEFGLDRFLYRAIDAGLRGPPFRIAPELAQQHLAFYAESNRALAARLGLPAGTDLFPASAPSGDPQPGNDLTGKMPVTALAQLLAFQLREADEQHAALQRRVSELERTVATLLAKQGNTAA